VRRAEGTEQLAALLQDLQLGVSGPGRGGEGEGGQGRAAGGARVAAELVKWRVELDGRGEAQREFRCKHVNLVAEGHEDHEKEYLFSAFSVFTVRSCAWSATPTRPDTPHVVTLVAALDNKEFPAEPREADLVLAPWC
jgi:hypothetical protein